MFQTFRLLTVFAAMISIPAAFARESAELDFSPEFFRAQARVLLSAAENASVSVFRGVDLRKVSADLESVRVDFSESVLVGMDSETNVDPSFNRFGGYYVDHRVFFWIHGVRVLLSAGIFPVLALHEFFGSLGYSDRSYELSYGLYYAVRAEPEARKLWLARAEFDPARRDFANIERTGGGGSHVGGGGDAIAIRLKRDVYEAFEKRNRRRPARKRPKAWCDFVSKLEVTLFEPGRFSDFFEGRAPKRPDAPFLPYFYEDKSEGGSDERRFFFNPAFVSPDSADFRDTYRATVDVLVSILERK